MQAIVRIRKSAILRQSILVGVALAASGLASAQLLPPRSKGMLTLEYVYASNGQWTDAQGNDRRDWRVSRKVSVSAQMVAENHSPVAALLSGTAAEKQDMAGREQRTQRGAQKVAPMMADIEAVMQKCGEDEACMEREAMRLASTMDEGAIRSAGQDAAAAGRPMNNNYQLWRVATYDGRYTADELYNAALADPDCLSAPRSQCVSQTTRKGNGPIPVTNTPLAVMMEVDGPGKRLYISLPIAAGNMPVTRTVTGEPSDGKPGTFPDQMPFPWTRIKPIAVPIPQGLDKANGIQRVKIDGEAGEGGTLTVSWRFALTR